jgi:hypothetical protein
MNLISLIKKHIFTLIITFSLAVIGIAIISDPFSLPFQDWDRMPEQQKQWYIEQSKICTEFKYLGVLGLLIGLLGSIYKRIKNPKKVGNSNS